jgi:UDPglucose--hexose-1-phosphate uridylyltransferase
VIHAILVDAMTADIPADEPAGLAPRRHHDPLAARTVLVAPRRAERPIELESADHGGGRLAECPFCAGNESLTPPDILRSPDAAAVPWQARIIPNRYPLVEDLPTGSVAAEEHAFAAASRPAHGVHDVVIESPAHVRSILDVDAARWRDVWELCRQRLAMLACRDDLVWATIFKNSGPRAGASLEHLHSQLVALDFVPPAIAAELEAAGRAADSFAELVRQAEAEGRIVAEEGDLVALVPHAIRQPFETWIVPRAAEAWFHATSPDRVAAVAALTRRFVSQLEAIVPGADYNWWLHQAPHANCTKAMLPDGWRWHLEILPRLASFAGFELGTGCHISVATPAESASLLRT